MADGYTPERRKAVPEAPQAVQAAPSPRVQETRARRRRRDDSGETLNRKLYVPERFLDRGAYEYRWINDDGSRIQDKTKFDDWDIVTADQMGDGYSEVARDQSDSKAVRRQVGKQDGRPVYAYFCRKPKEFHEEDQRKKLADIAAQEETMRRGPLPNKEGLGQAEAYVPGGRANHIGRAP